MDAADPFSLQLAAVTAARRREALWSELMALRTLRRELQAARPGLFRAWIDGWRAPSAVLYGDRMGELSAMLDRVEGELELAEFGIDAECDRLAAEEAVARRAATPDHAVTATGRAPWSS
ncbi:hypothetical protein [Agromyces sp. SYSU T0242]|uniref:hypothetical protein n=1 Tax=Agromyces litoreus TaxID=3158561 RepID=UPI0033932A2D